MCIVYVACVLCVLYVCGVCVIREVCGAWYMRAQIVVVMVVGCVGVVCVSVGWDQDHGSLHGEGGV